MKKIGKLYTAKGKGLTGTVERLQLFDGKFDTGYRLVGIEISNTDPMTGAELLLKVMTEYATPSSTWDWSSNTELAWASVNTPINSRWGYNSYVDPDNLIVEDVYLDFSGTADEEINYMLTFQKYEISDWRGALAMVRNKSQG